MKKLHLSIPGVFLLCLTACNESVESVIPTPEKSVRAVISPRGTSASESLPEGATVWFNARGALNATDQRLTYSEGKWTSQDSLAWDSTTGSTTYTALYPVYETRPYTARELYTDNGLTDILIAQDTLTGKQDIVLSFKHLFSQMVVHASTSIQKDLLELRLTVPHTVTALSTDGQATTEATAHTTTLSKNENGSYAFLLPPMQESQLTLDILTTDGSHTVTLPAQTFRSGVKYECRLRTSAGIMTAEDLIAFSQLINGKAYEGKTLDDFGGTEGNDTVFYLLDDIELTEEDCTRLLPIGYDDKHGFKYTFEGNNHTISHLTVPDPKVNSKVEKAYCGLFGYIAPEGTVRNLHLSQAECASTPSYSYIGILAAQNAGNIHHCSVSQSTISLSSGTVNAQGVLCAKNAGSLINCFAQGNHIVSGADAPIGTMAGYATGYILNCYAYNNTFTKKSSSCIGGIAGMGNSKTALVIANCCVYHPVNNTGQFGTIIERALAATTIHHVFHNNGKACYEGSGYTLTGNYTYDSLYQVDGIHLSSYLNDWIETTGATSYPDLEFKKWSTDTTALPTFQ